MVWLRLDKTFFKISCDIYLCGIQLWNEDSPMYNVINVDFFDELENDISLYDDLGDVYVCGDFNSRVGHKHDFIMYDDNSYFINQLKQDLSESKNEVKQLSEQVRNLKNREQSLDAENKIMKS